MEFSVKLPDVSNVVKLKHVLKGLIEELPVQIELQQQLAKFTRAKYKALIAEGFTKEEALTLCK